MRFLTILALFLLVLAPTGALAAKKVALIIGNDNYREISTLLKAREDAQGYRNFFRGEGYKIIGDGDGVKVDDLTRTEMRRALRAFYNNIEKGSQAIFIYSGHGWSDGVRNYLVPTDAPSVVDEDEVIDASIVLQDGYNGVIDNIKKKGARLTVALIDACRNDPFKHRGTTRAYGTQRGLAAIPKEAMPFGTYVMYSAGAHQEALDRLSQNDTQRYSVFTRHFLPLLKQRQPLRQAFNTARFQTFEAAKKINHEQLPAQYDEVVQPNICLSDTCKMSTTTSVSTPPPLEPQGSQCEKMWDLVMSNSNSCADLRRFASGFPGSQCARNAERRMTALSCPGYGQQQAKKPTVETYTATDFDNSRAEHLDLRRYNNSSLEACKRNCINDGQCNYFTYNERYRVCFTKKGVSKRVAFNGAISGKVVRPGQSAPSTPQQTQPQQTPRPAPQPAPQVASNSVQFQTYNNTDFPGGDMTFSNGSIFTKTSEAGCRRICENERRCKAFTYNQRNNACFIKSQVGPRASFKGAVSGVVRNR